MVYDKIIGKRVDIDASVSTVWNALTDPKAMEQWMSDDSIAMEIMTDWVVGKPIMIRGDLHGIPYESKGTILLFEPEKMIRYSYWSSLSQIPDEPENYSVVEFGLEPTGNRTRVTLTQSNFRIETMYQHSNFYWNTALGMMQKLVNKSNTL